jgi:hypothetical protein
MTNFPVLSIATQHQWIFLLADFPIIIVLHSLYVLRSLNSLIFGKRALVPLSSCVSKEVRAHRLNGTVDGTGKRGHDFEGLVAASPSVGKDG